MKPSLRLAVLLLLIHATAAISVYMLALPLAARFALILMILFGMLYYLARDALLLLPDSWCTLSVDHGHVSLADRNGAYFSGQTAGQTIVSPYFIVLSVKLDERRLPVFLTIFPDALGSDAFRELCVSLRFS